MRRSVVLHLRLGDHAVMQPVGDVLAGDAQRGAVLHQADVVDVRHLGAADALVDPAHDIAEDALGVVVELLLHVVGRPVRDGPRPGWSAGRRACRGACAAQLGLPRGDVDLVVMQGVQRGGGRRGHPGGVGAGLGWPIFCSSMSAIRSGAAHMPLPICARPRRPQARPMSTLRSS